MANQVSLLTYLQRGPPAITVNLHGQSKDNTTSKSYSAAQIINVGAWTDFNLNTIMQQYHALLINSQIEDEAMIGTPPQPISSEEGVKERFGLYLRRRVRLSLRNTFNHLITNNQFLNRTAVDIGEGSLSKLIDQYTPDLSYYDPNLPNPTRPNRAPGEFKISYKWSMDMRDGTQRQQKEFKQVLSQVNFYMKQHKTRYGFVLTDRELIAIRRLDFNGNLELSDSIPWTTQGNQVQPRLTVLLALWYLGMLASDDQQWRLE